MGKKYMGHIFPAMLSFLLTGVYSIIDGIFVGRAMGDSGLAAINIAWPLFSLFISLGTGIGMGAAVSISLNIGAGKIENAKKAEGNAIMLLFFSSLLLTGIMYLFGAPLLQLLGANGDLFPYAFTYLRYILLGGWIQVMASGLVPLLRTHGASFYAMCSMALGCISNIILDYYFVIILRLELKGAAVATILGQLLTLLLCFAFYMRKKNRLPLSYLVPARKTVLTVMRIALSPFGLTYLPSITIILMNLQTLRYGGDEAVSAYSVLAYIISFMELLVQGIGDGSQPLISHSCGSKNHALLKKFAIWTFSLSISLGLIGSLCFILIQNQIPAFYGTSQKAAVYIGNAAPAFAVIMGLYGFTKPAVSYLYATHKVHRSAFMVYGEILLTAVLIFVLPSFMGINGVWYTIPLVQGILTLSGIFFLIKK